MEPAQTEQGRPTLLLPVAKDQKPFKCGLCSFAFDIIIELDSHISEHSLTKPFQCGYCYVSYDTSSELTVHVDIHQLFVCVAKGPSTQFSETSSSENSARMKNDTSHMKTKRDSSETCPQVKKNTNALKAKETSLADLGDSDSCAEAATNACIADEMSSSTSKKDSVNSKQQRKAILSIKFPTKKMVANCFSCPLCTQSFKFQADLKKHSITDHGDDRPFQCSRCPSRFKQKNHLTDHLNSVHRAHKPYACPFCGDRFKIRSYLKHHMSRKHQVDSVSSSSAQSKSKHVRDNMEADTADENGCSARKKAFFISDSHLYYGNTEFEIADSEEIEFGSEGKTTSDAAGDGFDSEEDEALPHSFMTTSLSAENNTAHTAAASQSSTSWNSVEEEQGIKVEFDSEIADCNPVMLESGKAYSVSAYAASVTDSSQNDVRLYKCGVCQLTFSSSNDMGNHWQSTHATCSLCGEWFSGPVGMNSHKKYCHGEAENVDRPFTCGICGTRFTVARYVREHIRKFH